VVSPGGADRADGEAVAARLGLAPLPGEGGLFRRTHLDAHSSAIYYLLLDPDFSALHVLTGPEVYHFHAGAPLRMLLLDPDGTAREPLLGPDPTTGQHPQLVVPAGTWQGARSTGAWSLVGTTMAPPYTEDGFRLGERADLVARWPTARDRIVELTR
jgi:predicted cupin superfamily sugar epimerase